MSALYVMLALLVVASFAGMFWLRRVADRSWRRHQILRSLAKDWVRFKVEVRDQLTPALREMARSIEAMAPAMQRFADAMRKETDPLTTARAIADTAAAAAGSAETAARIEGRGD